MNTKIAVIGCKADTLPFKAAGFNTFELDAPIDIHGSNTSGATTPIDMLDSNKFDTNNSHIFENGASTRGLTDLITQLADQGIGIIFIIETLLAQHTENHAQYAASQRSAGTTTPQAPAPGQHGISSDIQPADISGNSNVLRGITDLFADAPLPAIIPIPGISGSLGIGTGAIRENIIRAAGADIIT